MYVYNKLYIVCSGAVMFIHYIHMYMYIHACTFLYTVGLFKPLSYQDRAVQLAHNNRTSQVCFEPFKPFSINASEAWQDGK